MATAHKVSVTVTKRGGEQKVYGYSTTDINAAFYLTPSGSNQQVLSSQDCHITDLAVSTQGTCTQVYVFFNNVNTGIVLFTPNCLTTVNRQVKSSPIFVPAGTLVKFQTIT